MWPVLLCVSISYLFFCIWSTVLCSFNGGRLWKNTNAQPFFSKKVKTTFHIMKYKKATCVFVQQYLFQKFYTLCASLLLNISEKNIVYPKNLFFVDHIEYIIITLCLSFIVVIWIWKEMRKINIWQKDNLWERSPCALISFKQNNERQQEEDSIDGILCSVSTFHKRAPSTVLSHLVCK